MLGGQGAGSLAVYQQTLQKLQDYLDFDVHLTLQVTQDAGDGAYLHGTWNSTARLKFKLDFAKGCYTSEFYPSQVNVQVTNFDSMVMVNLTDGQRLMPATLTSPHSYKAMVGTPQVDLCAEQPTFQVPTMSWQIPPEMLTVNGVAAPAPLLPTFMAALTATNEVNSGATNALGGQAPTLPAGASDSEQLPNMAPPTNQNAQQPDQDAQQDSPPSPAEQSFQQAQQLLQAHSDDPSWIMSPEGQAAMKSMQQAASQKLQTVMASKGIVVPMGNNVGAIMQSFFSVHVPWSNGQVQPVNKTLHMKKDPLDETLTVTARSISSRSNHAGGSR